MPSIRVNIIFFITFLIAIGHQTHAQNKNIFGAIVGMNVSSVSDYHGKTAVGITGGLYWEWKFSDLFSLQSNFLYSQRGEREDDATPELRVDYMNLPIMTKYYLTDNFQVMTGIFWDLLLRVKGHTYSNNDFTNSDFGIPIGLSYALSENLQVGLSYNFGLTNISGTTTNNFAPRNNWGNVTIALLIR